MNVGILGAGQLGRMLALAGAPLGIRCHTFDEIPDAPAAVASVYTRGRFADLDALRRWAEALDVVTYEFEHIPLEAARAVAEVCALRPGVEALAVTQCRRAEKEALRKAGLPTVPWAFASTLEELPEAIEQVGLPAVVKTARLGYDGKGQFVVRSAGDLAAATDQLRVAPPVGGMVVEGWVEFDRELSALVVFGAEAAELTAYPLTENWHQGGILRRSIAPAAVDDASQARALEFARRLLDSGVLGAYRGVLTLELFESATQSTGSCERDGPFVVNELAPRVHNSGHWTIEGAATSQFENHLRAICGYGLGVTSAIGASIMWNCLGAMPAHATILKTPHAHLHSYEKQPRAGRKVGHVTLHYPDGVITASEAAPPEWLPT